MRFRRITSLLALSMILSLILFAAPASALVLFERKFGTQGTGVEQLYHPWGVTSYTELSTNATRVYVADTINHRIQVYDGRGNYLMQIGRGPGQADGELYYPEALVVSPDGLTLYVADSANNRIQEYGAVSGEWIRKWGTAGVGEGQFNVPRGIALDSDGNIYIADSRNHRVQKFSASGTFIKQWGIPGEGDGHFIVPAGIAVFSDTVFVADEYAATIQEFTLDGIFLRRYGELGGGPGQLSSPDEITVGPLGSLYVAEAGSSRVSVFNTGDRASTDRFVGTFTGTSQPDTHLQFPHGVWFDPIAEALFVTSTNESVIYKYAMGASRKLAINVDPNKKESSLKQRSGLFYKVSHNEMLETCFILSDAELKVPDKTPEGIVTRTFKVKGPRTPVKPQQVKAYEIPLSGAALRLSKEALNQGRTVRVDVEFSIDGPEHCFTLEPSVERVRYQISG